MKHHNPRSRCAKHDIVLEGIKFAVTPASKKRYTKNACDACRRWHRACDNLPVCGHCERKNLTCKRRLAKPISFVDCTDHVKSMYVEGVDFSTSLRFKATTRCPETTAETGSLYNGWNPETVDVKASTTQISRAETFTEITGHSGPHCNSAIQPEFIVESEISYYNWQLPIAPPMENQYSDYYCEPNYYQQELYYSTTRFPIQDYEIYEADETWN